MINVQNGILTCTLCWQSFALRKAIREVLKIWVTTDDNSPNVPSKKIWVAIYGCLEKQ